MCMQAAGAAQQLAESNLAATGLLLEEAERELKVSACLYSAAAQCCLTAVICLANRQHMRPLMAVSVLACASGLQSTAPPPECQVTRCKQQS